MAFISFIAENPLGSAVEGLVDVFTSHGAEVVAGDVRCYVPLSGLGDPPPRSAREMLRKGEKRLFLITALDPHRRGVELALPEVGVVRGVPTEETVAAEVAMTRRRRRSSTPVDTTAKAEPPTKPTRSPRKAAATKKTAVAPAASEPTPETVVGDPAPKASRVPKKSATKTLPTPRKSPGATKAAAKKSSTASASMPEKPTPRKRKAAVEPTSGGPRRSPSRVATSPAKKATTRAKGG